MSHVGRRRFLAASGALIAAPVIARAQPAKELPVLGWLSPSRRPSPQEIANFPTTKRLAQRGWIEGKTLRIERAYGEGSQARLPELAARLVSSGVDVIGTFGPEAAVAAARATTTIPIVFWGVAWPVEIGLIDSFARPGRNVTGVAWQAGPEVNGKRIELLREMVPQARRLAILSVPTALATVAGGRIEHPWGELEAQARSLEFEAQTFPVSEPADIDPAFAAIERWNPDAFYVPGTALTYRERHRIAAFALRRRLPSVYTLSAFADAGGMIAYAIDIAPTWFRIGDYLDRILRGANPAELPVELPTRYLLVVNVKTVKALGLDIPQSILLRADRVIE